MMGAECKFYVITQKLLQICAKELYMNQSSSIIMCGFVVLG